MRMQTLKKTRVLYVLRVLLHQNPHQTGILPSTVTRHGIDTALSCVSIPCLALNFKKTFIYKAFRATRHTRHARHEKNAYPEKLLGVCFTSLLEKIKNPLSRNSIYLFFPTSAPLCLTFALLRKTQRGGFYIAKEHQ